MKQLFLLSGLLVGLLSFGQKAREYKVVKSYPIASTGGWDYIAVHDGKLYVSHATQVNILDEYTGDSLGIIPNTAGVHGIAFNDALNRGYTSNGRANNVTVFDLRSRETVTRIATGENPDAIMYEPFTKSIITCNGRSKNLSVINPATNQVTATIDVGGKPETAVSDGTGMLFVNVEDKNEIVAVDLKSNAVKSHWPLGGAEGPTGLSFDKTSRRLFAGCDKQLVVVDASNGKIISKLPIGEGCDGVAFSAKDQIIYTSNGGDGTMTAVKEDRDKYTVLGNYPTSRGGRTITIDDKDGTVFIPAAEYEAANDANGRPHVKPGSFKILVVK
ncbi:MAG: YncE family protein [Williamsia sp.]|nr:YncE family protein [Williamsia sp.]